MLAQLVSNGACEAPLPRTQSATCPGHVWALDFQFDSNFQGTAFTICTVIDEKTGGHGGVEVGWSMTGYCGD